MTLRPWRVSFVDDTTRDENQPAASLKLDAFTPPLACVSVFFVWFWFDFVQVLELLVSQFWFGHPGFLICLLQTFGLSWPIGVDHSFGSNNDSVHVCRIKGLPFLVWDSLNALALGHWRVLPCVLFQQCIFDEMCLVFGQHHMWLLLVQVVTLECKCRNDLIWNWIKDEDVWGVIFFVPTLFTTTTTGTLMVADIA